MKAKYLLTALLLACTVLSSCGELNPSDNTANNTSEATGDLPVATINTDEMFTNRDNDISYNVRESAIVTLDGDRAVCNSSGVIIEGSKITVTDEGDYIFRGALNDGMIIVNAKATDKLRIVLDGADITSKTSAALYVMQADKVVLTLAEGSENSLSSGETFVQFDENNIDSAVYSRDDLTLNGRGSLTVNSPAGHGIVSKDDLVITSGTYNVTSSSHGICANDSVRIANCTISVKSGKDGIQSDNNNDVSRGYVYIKDGKFSIISQGDGISSSSTMLIDGGTFNITCGGGSENGTKTHSDSYGQFPVGPPGGGRPPMERSTDTSTDSKSMKAFKSGATLTVNDGYFKINSADDSLHTNKDLVINSGTFEIASGDDGIHADGNLTVNGGNINIPECYEGLEALNITFNGGDVSLTASDDGLNVASGNDGSGLGGRDDVNFGGFRPGGGDHGGGAGNVGSGSNGSIVITGGTLNITAYGDGIDANGTLQITGGFTQICGPTTGDTATLDYDKSAVITGGTFIGTGAMGMAQTFSTSDQGLLSFSVGNQSANTEIKIFDSTGTEVFTHTPKLDYAVVIVSSPKITKGESYSITVGSVSGNVTAQ